MKEKCQVKETPNKEAFARKLALYDALVATHPRAVRTGVKIPSTSLNGHMYSYLGKNGELAMKLSGRGARKVSQEI